MSSIRIKKTVCASANKRIILNIKNNNSNLFMSANKRIIASLKAGCGLGVLEGLECQHLRILSHYQEGITIESCDVI
jgi:hypothetical protein